MKVLVIANPIAGGGKAPRYVDELEAALRSHDCDVETFLTGASGDAKRRAGDIEDDVDRVVSVGGDGTLNEVVNGLADPSRIPIAQLPLGTANILARELGFHWTPDQVAKTVADGRVRNLDLGIANGTRFVAVTSAGFDAMVTRDIQKHRTGALGARGYLMPTLRSAMQYHAPTMRVTVDDGEPIEGALVVISNIRNYAGLFSIADQACPDSGHLDVCLFPNGSHIALACYLAAALTRTVSKVTNVNYMTGKKILVDSDEPVAVEIDGDYVGDTPLEVTVEPGALPMLVPKA